MKGVLGATGRATTGMGLLPLRHRPQCHLFWVVFAAGVCLSSLSVFAADITWTDGSSTYETNSNWSSATVPTINDRAIFDDSATASGYTVTLGVSESLADALFSATTKSVIWKVGNANTWTITNSFVFDGGASGTATGDLASGTITVTNTSGSGLFAVGNSVTGGRGIYKMELATSGATPPSVIADQFIMTANSDFFFRGGTLTTLGGSTINRGAQTGFCIGTNSTSTAGRAYWNMLGGTNSITYNSGGATYLGYLSGTFGGVLVSGSNTLWSVGGGSLTIGNTGQGALTISNGAHVTSAEVFVSRNATSSTNNVVMVTDAGSRWDISGNGENSFGYQGSTNQTYVLGGAAVVLSGTGTATLGNGSLSSVNQLTVSGTNSLFQASGGLFVGVHGSGNTLIATNAGTVALVGTGSLTMGSFIESTNNLVEVSGGSLLVNAATITVGNHGANNTLSIDNNGTVTVNGGNLYVSAQSDAINNTIVVSGGNLAVSNSTGSAVLDVNHTSTGSGSFTLNSGTVSADRLIVKNGANTRFTFNGGVLNVTATDPANSSQISNGSVFSVGNGTQAATLNLAAGALFSVANGLQISSNAVLMGTGTISGNTTSYGTVSPGHSTDTLVFAGSLTLTPNSVLAMEIGGQSPGQFDQIIVRSGAFAADGTLSISLINGFDPANGDSFQLLDLSSSTSVTGAFAGFSLPALGGGLSWDTSQLLVTGDLNVVPEPSSLALVIGGCGLLAWLGNRRRSRQHEPQRRDS